MTLPESYDLRTGNIVHELGHATAAEHWGWEVYRIEVGDFPQCRYRMPIWVRNGSKEGRRRELVVTVAGFVAECKWVGRPADFALLHEWDLVADMVEYDDPGVDQFDDCGDAYRLLRHLPREQAEAEIREAIEFADEILTENWEKFRAKFVEYGEAA